MPLCVLAATAFDWRADFIPIVTGLAVLVLIAPSGDERVALNSSSVADESVKEPAPLALAATTALAFVSGAMLTVLSGFLVFNAGQTEWHISAGLLIGALLGLTAPPAINRLSQRLAPGLVYGVVLACAAIVLCALLALRGPLPATLAVCLIGLFLAVSSARHLALARLVPRGLSPAQLRTHQTRTHLAHHLGAGMGALTAGFFVYSADGHTLSGLPGLVCVALLATVLALVTGLLSSQPIASPAARAASASSNWRVVTSFVRSVRTSITRTP
jgi:predicted MFS family arabinose efflux permease